MDRIFSPVARVFDLLALHVVESQALYNGAVLAHPQPRKVLHVSSTQEAAKLYRGAQGLAAEFGHTKLVFDGPLCQCGERGCMETHTAAFAIIHEAAKAGFRIPKRPLDYNERSMLIQAIVAKAEAGDQSMKQIFEQMGRYLGLGIANLVNLLNPQRIVICQGAIRCAHLFEDSLRSVAEQMVIPPLKRNLEIVIHHWGDEVWARGAASLVLLELDQRGRSEMPKSSPISGRRAARNGKIRAAVNTISV